MELNLQQVLDSSGFSNYADIKRLRVIIEALKANIPANGLVLDVGCGNGLITQSLGRAGFTVYGIDISEKAIEKAKAGNTLPNVHYAVVSAEELSVSTTKYDGIVCSEVLEHLQQPGELLKVIHQSMKDDGTLVVTVPNGKGPREVLITKPIIRLQQKNNWVWRFMQKFKHMLGYRGTTVQSDADDLTHIQFFTRPALRTLAAQHNFTIRQFGKINFVENVFPFSLLAKRIRFLQKLDCAIADLLPYGFTCGFTSVWKKNN